MEFQSSIADFWKLLEGRHLPSHLSSLRFNQNIKIFQESRKKGEVTFKDSRLMLNPATLTRKKGGGTFSKELREKFFSSKTGHAAKRTFLFEITTALWAKLCLPKLVD